MCCGQGIDERGENNEKNDECFECVHGDYRQAMGEK
jgi:hypothetical protein